MNQNLLDILLNLYNFHYIHLLSLNYIFFEMCLFLHIQDMFFLSFQIFLLYLNGNNIYNIVLLFFHIRLELLLLKIWEFLAFIFFEDLNNFFFSFFNVILY